VDDQQLSSLFEPSITKSVCHYPAPQLNGPPKKEMDLTLSKETKSTINLSLECQVCIKAETEEFSFSSA
jgi:hypothetical protein